jgi:hypothetical protein
MALVVCGYVVTESANYTGNAGALSFTYHKLRSIWSGFSLFELLFENISEFCLNLKQFGMSRDPCQLSPHNNYYYA